MKRIVCFVSCLVIFLKFSLVGYAQVLDVFEDENPSLRIVCAEIDIFDKTLLNKVDNLKETLEKLEGAGLAANQVGYTEKFFVIFVSSKIKDEIKYISGASRPEKDKPFVFINPKILKETGEQFVWEGCFSLPGAVYRLVRPMAVLIEAFDIDGQKFTLEATGFWAKCVCHEYDHLRGILCKDKAIEVKKVSLDF